MSTTTTIQNAGPALTLSSSSVGRAGRMKLDGQPTNFGDWRDELNVNGYAVIKGAIPRERAEAYSDKFYSYIEGL